MRLSVVADTWPVLHFCRYVISIPRVPIELYQANLISSCSNFKDIKSKFWLWEHEHSNCKVGSWLALYSRDLISQHSNSKLIGIANFHLFGIQMVTDWKVWTIWLASMVLSSGTKCYSVMKLFIIPKANYLFCYSRHGLNSRSFNERTVLDHLNTELVFYSDSHNSIAKTDLNKTFSGPTLTSKCPIVQVQQQVCL